MPAKQYSRGHEIKNKTGGWVYSDNNEPAFNDRICKTCDKKPKELLLKNDEGKWEAKEIDTCIAPIVVALQTAGINMISSCCGHKIRNGWITLADGRILTIKKESE